MIIVPFVPDHLRKLLMQPSQLEIQPMLQNNEYARSLQIAGPAFTGMDDDYNVICCLGVVKQWENRGLAWGLIGDKAPDHFVAIHRAVRRFLDLQDIKRIEAAVMTEFPEGHRWIKMLGFKYEGTMQSYTPRGDNYDLYARIR